MSARFAEAISGEPYYDLTIMQTYGTRGPSHQCENSGKAQSYDTPSFADRLTIDASSTVTNLGEKSLDTIASSIIGR
jgi:hypothetical protein